MIYQHPDRQIPLTVILLKSDIMRGTMYLFLLLISTMCIFGAHADDNSITTSKDYVDSQVATLQDEIPAINSNTVLTHTGTSGEIGTKQIYDENADYASQQNSLVSAGTFNTAIQNAIDNEFVCIDWLGEHVPNNCLLWKINQLSGKNLFNKHDPEMQFKGYVARQKVGISSHLVSNPTQGDKTLFVKVNPNTTYTIQRNTNIDGGYNRIRTCSFSNSNTPTPQDTCTILTNIEDPSTDHITFTTLNNTHYLAIYVRNVVAQPQNDWQEFLDSFQVEQGDIATNYEPYQNIYMPTGN